MAVEKQQRKRKIERKWKANEETGGSYKLYENLKLGEWYLLVKFKKLSTFKILRLLFKVYFCLRFCL